MEPRRKRPSFQITAACDRDCSQIAPCARGVPFLSSEPRRTGRSTCCLTRICKAKRARPRPLHPISHSARPAFWSPARACLRGGGGDYVKLMPRPLPSAPVPALGVVAPPLHFLSASCAFRPRILCRVPPLHLAAASSSSLCIWVELEHRSASSFRTRLRLESPSNRFYSIWIFELESPKAKAFLSLPPPLHLTWGETLQFALCSEHAILEQNAFSQVVFQQQQLQVMCCCSAVWACLACPS